MEQIFRSTLPWAAFQESVQLLAPQIWAIDSLAGPFMAFVCHLVLKNFWRNSVSHKLHECRRGGWDRCSLGSFRMRSCAGKCVYDEARHRSSGISWKHCSRVCTEREKVRPSLVRTVTTQILKLRCFKKYLWVYFSVGYEAVKYLLGRSYRSPRSHHKFSANETVVRILTLSRFKPLNSWISIWCAYPCISYWSAFFVSWAWQQYSKHLIVARYVQRAGGA